jgi:hypothetical protein
MKWYFKQQQPGDITRNPIVGEFFSTDAIDNPAEALIREGIQNALDAREKSQKKVRIRIFISQGNKAISKWIGTAWLHLKAKGNGLQGIPSEIDPCPYLVFEDFGTTGLQGDETQPFDVDEKKNSFFYFFRAEGLSGKGGDDRGRWGVGKHVFPRSSRISTYFGFTVRANDKKKMLMGHTILKSHRVGKINFMPDGYFGVQQPDQLILPFNDETMLAEFAKDFNLSREAQPGLSIVVPHIDPEINLERIMQAVISGYFHPILEDKLVVSVETEDKKIEISRTTILQESTGLKDDRGNDLSPMLKFAEWCISNSQERLYELNQCSEVPPAWSDQLIPKEMLNKMRTELDSGENMAFHVNLKVQNTESPAQSYFNVYISQDNGKNEHPVFIREGITISNVKTPRVPGIRALVIIEDKPLATLLGDSENPAHTEWQKGSQTFKNKHPNGKRYIEFVASSVSRLGNALSAEEDEKDPYLFADIFSLPLSGEGRFNKIINAKKTGKDINPPPLPPPLPTSQDFAVTKIKNGFKVTSNKTITDLPVAFKILTAYNVRRGSPFKKYNEADFYLKESMVSSNGVKIVRVQGNEILCEITSPDFEIEVKGFDTKRDLIVKPGRVKGGEDD